MSFRFYKARPIISLFHSPNVPASTQALELLQKAGTTLVKSKPLDFDLEVVENQQPTADQIRTIMSYKSLPFGISAGGGDSTSNNPRLSSFISAHPAVAGLSSPSSAEDLAKMAVSNPKVLKYPLAVNWDEGEVSIGSVDGVKEIIENMRKRRDSEMSSSSDTPMKPKGWWF